VKHGQAANERQTEPALAGEAGNLATAELGRRPSWSPAALALLEALRR
jgi:hypothetical protein